MHYIVHCKLVTTDYVYVCGLDDESETIAACAAGKLNQRKCRTCLLVFDGPCMPHANASAIITETRNIITQNSSSFDGCCGNGTFNSFDFSIVSE